MQTKSLVQRPVKGLASKVSVSCLDAIKFYNKYMGGVDLVDLITAAYHLDRNSSIRFYLRIFFDLMDVACATNWGSDSFEFRDSCSHTYDRALQ